MPVETGPTMYLPHSQKYEAGLRRLPPAGVHRATSTSTTSSCRCAKGDAAFFNPALFHGAGTNRSARRAPDGQPAAGLLRLRPGDGERRPGRDEPGALPGAARRRAAGADERDLRNVVAASAEGYAFPTNLDRDQPIGGLAPQTQAELVRRALAEGWDTATFTARLDAHTGRRATGPA